MSKFQAGALFYPLMASASLIALAAAPANAQAVKAFSIPAQAAVTGLPQFGQQAGTQVLASSSDLQGVNTNAVVGDYTVNAAAQKLLAGSPLKARFTAEGNMVVVRGSDAVADKDPAPAQITPAPEASPTVVVITGSHLSSKAAKAPTPLTVITTAQLTQTTPSNIPDGLNKLPIFQGGSQPRRAGDGTANFASNVLSLRGFGPQRTLVLLDGHRVTPSNTNGTVDADTLPQILVSRVDVVTGGASAVYGSDAVAGVVNFVLDDNFKGLKYDINGGESKYRDGASFKASAAWGADAFSGRGHFIVAAEYNHSDPVAMAAREIGRDVYVLTGAGTAANPYVASSDVRKPDSAFGGRISGCTSPCSALGEQFVTNGVLGAFNPGTPTGTKNLNIGGDGTWAKYTTALVRQNADEFFTRFGYDIDDQTRFFVQLSAASDDTFGHHFPVKMTPSLSVNATTGLGTPGNAAVFFKNNPFLSPAVQSALGNNGLSDMSNVFTLGEYIDLGPNDMVGEKSRNSVYTFSAGLNGQLWNSYHWDLFYSHGESDTKLVTLNNSNYQRQFAAADAVMGADGQIHCYAALQAATAAQYAGCVPLNPFGPTALSQAAFNGFTGTTWWNQSNQLDDFEASLSGDAFNDWAGPVSLALSAEARFNKLTITSNTNAAATVDCTGLRICNANLPLWAQPVYSPVSASNNVWEVAVEAGVPLAADLPLIKSLDANIAGRYTDYSTSGIARTWKLGLTWDITDEWRLRGTQSVDIRAPSLYDLFAPQSVAAGTFVDQHTQSSQTTFFYTGGNPNLKPEQSYDQTYGIVWRPKFARSFTASLDYYSMKMTNALATLSPTDPAIQGLCEASNGTSPFCALMVRPGPFSDHSVANFPTKLYNENLNAALVEIKGYDFEANYHLNMADLKESWEGAWDFRLVGNYQPVSRSQTSPVSPVLQYATTDPLLGGITSPKWRATTFVNYTVGDWTFGLEDRWYSRFNQTAIEAQTIAATGVKVPQQVWANPILPAYNVVDIDVTHKMRVMGRDTQLYLNVGNLFNAKPTPMPVPGSVGLNFPVPPYEDTMGQYFTIGIRAKM
jgi:outer membrane receptor protein involved in Fe transport